MRLVLDTNVLLAAFLSRGACHDLLEHVQQQHQIVLSAFIPEEFSAKLSGKFRVPEPVNRGSDAAADGDSRAR